MVLLLAGGQGAGGADAAVRDGDKHAAAVPLRDAAADGDRRLLRVRDPDCSHHPGLVARGDTRWTRGEQLGVPVLLFLTRRWSNLLSVHLVIAQRFLETMRAIQGALIVSSSIQIILGYSQLWGIFSRCSSSQFTVFKHSSALALEQIDAQNAYASQFGFDSALLFTDWCGNAYPLSDSSAQWGWRQWSRCSGLAFSKEDSLWYRLLCPHLHFMLSLSA